jgi:hypothetical protein
MQTPHSDAVLPPTNPTSPLRCIVFTSKKNMILERKTNIVLLECYQKRQILLNSIGPT